MAAFKNGVSENVHVKGKKLKHLRVKAGPQRDQYVHAIVFEAKILGRREAWDRLNPSQPCPEDEFYSYLQSHETIDHDDQDSLNNSPGNLVRMTRGGKYQENEHPQVEPSQEV